MPRYEVTFTRQVTQTATFIVEADSADDAATVAEDTPTTREHITTSGDNALDDGWAWSGAPREITPAAVGTFRRRLAAAIGYDERPRPPRHPQ